MSPPEIAWTGIGSLPFSDESEALKHALSAYPRRPFVPELDRPEASGGMLAAVLPPLPLIAGGGFGVRVALSGTDPALAEAFLPTELAVSQTPLLRFWNGFLPGLSAAIGSTGVKAQLCGPVTLLRCVRDQY
ncbi:MAG: hypothetical protein KDB53_05940, partial [Planctomycetes bacterium]|nr:hypothetical protein [Planctomycetota bacterium]